MHQPTSQLTEVDQTVRKEKKLKIKKKLRDIGADSPSASRVTPEVDKQQREEIKKAKRKRESELTDNKPPRVENIDHDSRKKKKKKIRVDDGKMGNGAMSASKSPNASPSEIEDFLKKHFIVIHGQVTPALSFGAFSLPSALRDAFDGFKEPTPIQACCWPPALEGRDVVGIAETGSGKTLAFGIPALAQINDKPTHEISILIIAPTRELALQTHSTMSELGARVGVSSIAIFGGVDKAPQIRQLSSKSKLPTKIVVGTPGRILDLINDCVLDLGCVNYLVLDEADRMLDRGFENDIRQIISHTPRAHCQTLMFSATWPESVRRLASTFQKNPVRVTVGSDDLTANARIKQDVEILADDRAKEPRLLSLLRSLFRVKSDDSNGKTRILVFALYKKEAARVEITLSKAGYCVGALHGDMAQSARMAALDRFRSGEISILVATDVAARGLDIPEVGTVVNYTFPLTIEDYIHRIGRTGRGGRSGHAVTFFTGNNHERSLAGELGRVLRDSGFEDGAEALGKLFPMTMKKKTHSAYGNFFRDDIPAPSKPSKIVF